MTSFGFVYVMRNDAMPGLYKVGFTERSPSLRALELSRGTGVPAPYEVAYYAEIERPAVWEGIVHSLLAGYRANEAREFFRAPLSLVIGCVRGDGEWLSEWLSDHALEALNPGAVNPNNPLWFERCLHDQGYLERIRRSAQQ